MEFASCITASTDQDPKVYCECQLGRIMTEAQDQVFKLGFLTTLYIMAIGNRGCRVFKGGIQN